ncbi:uncharacterized protein LOC110393634 isoform X1 [Numida meleagris]|uniref:uncharacterized protein LOC110393634 isoform X1 n=1 Tax=Numida meleagris TaxID=8996 RepID=UPI000B3E13A5|nr:uncharacterized protein LOC110393634 isoform X1 [Numida meleagris]
MAPRDWVVGTVGRRLASRCFRAQLTAPRAARPHIASPKAPGASRPPRGPEPPASERCPVPLHHRTPQAELRRAAPSPPPPPHAARSLPGLTEEPGGHRGAPDPAAAEGAERRAGSRAQEQRNRDRSRSLYMKINSALQRSHRSLRSLRSQSGCVFLSEIKIRLDCTRSCHYGFPALPFKAELHRTKHRAVPGAGQSSPSLHFQEHKSCPFLYLSTCK